METDVVVVVVVCLENEIKTSLGDSKSQMCFFCHVCEHSVFSIMKPRSMICDMSFNMNERDCKEVWCPTSILENQQNF